MITTSILDAARGVPGARIPVTLDVFITGHGWKEVGRGMSNVEGKIMTFGEMAVAGVYRLTYDVGSYITDAFFPSISIVIDVRDPSTNYHVPLMVTPFGYSTYRMTLEASEMKLPPRPQDKYSDATKSLAMAL